MKLEELQKLTNEDLMKMTKKQLIALYEDITEGPSVRFKNKEDAVGSIKRIIRSISRGAAFSKYA